MTAHSRAARLSLLALMMTLCAVACSRENEGGRAPSEATRTAAVPQLPDLSNLDPALQQQLRSEYASLERSSGGNDERAGRYGRMGTLLLAAEYPAAAERFFEAARTLAPRDMRWPYYLGHVRRAGQELDGAAAAFTDANRLDPAHLPTLVWLADTHLALGRPEAAEPYLQTATKLDPSSAAAWFHRGRVAIARRQFEAARDYLERALALAPDGGAVHYQLGLAYRGLGDRIKAEEHLSRRVGADSVVPVDPLMDGLPALLLTGAAHLTRGLEAMERRDWRAAVEYLRMAVAASPRDGVAHLNLGTALFLAGERQAAREALETAVRVAPALPKAHYTLGLVVEADRQDDEALEHFAEAVRLDAAYLEAHASLADALRRSGRVEQSLTHYSRVLELDPAASQARFGYAMGLVRLERYREARDWLRQAASLHADQPGFAHALARVLAASPDASARDGGEALRLTEALRQSHQSPALAETMAMALAEVGRFDEAVRWQQEAMAAVRAAGQPDAAARMDANLARYRRRQPCRMPWAPDDPVHVPRPAA